MKPIETFAFTKIDPLKKPEILRNCEQIDITNAREERARGGLSKVEVGKTSEAEGKALKHQGTCTNTQPPSLCILEVHPTLADEAESVLVLLGRELGKDG